MIEMSETINDLAAALAKAQARIHGAIKGSDNPALGKRYADLSAIWAACRTALTKNGLSVVQFPGETTEGHMTMTTMLMHASGQWIRQPLSIPLSRIDAQGYGSATTYARRYSLAAVVGVCPADDDGIATSDASSHLGAAPEPLPSGPIDAAQLTALAEAADADQERLCRYLRVPALSDLPARHYQAALRALEQSRGLSAQSSRQGSGAWFALRCGRVTASRAADLIARTKTGWGASRAHYMAQLVVERLTGTVEPSHPTAAMRWGTQTEPEARAAYQLQRDVAVREADFILHPDIFMAGASPDGLVGEDGLVEIKCPNSATHIEVLRSATIPERYQLQMLWQMACTGRAWCDFLSYDPRFPEPLRLFIKRLDRDEARIAELERQVEAFIAELDEAVTAIEARHATPTSAGVNVINLVAA